MTRSVDAMTLKRMDDAHYGGFLVVSAVYNPNVGYCSAACTVYYRASSLLFQKGLL